ncbi:CLUMA_CG016094, isoform A [Clunio marinus]|uniref:CLUMA_CG016094, isoform A n=1 Tax=Clunio marinus TaxID=568069 RepID=A0A1J1IRK2_9DIPT|nr:CLUMA_CG016094, isoform A [Clunio marinus]
MNVDPRHKEGWIIVENKFGNDGILVLLPSILISNQPNGKVLKYSDKLFSMLKLSLYEGFLYSFLNQYET